MKTDRRKFIASSLLSAGALSLPVQADGTGNSSDEPKAVSVRGRIVCLTEELDKRYQVIPDCENRGHLYTLKTTDEKFYTILPVDTAAAIWMDERFRKRELQVTGRIFPQGLLYRSFQAPVLAQR